MDYSNFDATLKRVEQLICLARSRLCDGGIANVDEPHLPTGTLARCTSIFEVPTDPCVEACSDKLRDGQFPKFPEILFANRRILVVVGGDIL